jgi:hypothetical protein
MTFDERAEQARNALFSRYDRLNNLWLQAEKELAKFHIPRTAEFCYQCYDDNGREGELLKEYLGVRKIKGKWRICLGSYRRRTLADEDPEGVNDEWTPITDCSAETRVWAVEYLPQLLEAVVKSAETFIPEVDHAIDKLRKALNGPDEHLRTLLAERAKMNGRAK